ncbi:MULTISPECIES: NADH-quinone oxidoreductase subunit C [Ferrimonas]|uniref:NADH-quinone oxidoreductase subunit C n=1 Tax=Ferrimonas TaxID=44011 RepID=UPI0003FE90CA|nr:MULTISPECIES: NADH-quinone oxidoreductase subunit C [Ferrimonas]USD36390.1 NADH-quinone oxidoreductase subunit C [Ferrimonas sp. SCSIO 43195]
MTPMFQSVAASLGNSLSQPADWSQSTNGKGVTVAWCRLSDAAQILPMARLIKVLDGRLSTITAYQIKQQPDGLEIAYHFDLDGDTLTATVTVDAAPRIIPSLTGVFRNADWNEREFMELYQIEVTGHPNPRRLFIDENIDPAVLQRFIPYSDLVNAASTKALWEKIMITKGDTQ